MNDRSFKPAGAAMAALVAGLAPAAIVEASQVQAPKAPGAKEAEARDALAQAAENFSAAEPFGAKPAQTRVNKDIPLGQLDLPFRS
jgi:hypothetical protein